MESKNVDNGASEASAIRIWKEVEIPMPWGLISGKWWGSSASQPVLALHGWQDNAGTWDTLMPLLPHDIPVFCIDLPGHGLSSHYPKGHFDFLLYEGAVVVRRIVNYFGWKKITILGHSLGGLIGFVYAALFPDDVEKLIEMDVAGPTVRPPTYVMDTWPKFFEKFLEYDDMTEEDMPCYNYSDMVNMAEDAYNSGSVNRESCKVMLERGITPSPWKSGFMFTRDVRLKATDMFGIDFNQVMAMADNIRCKYLNIRALPYTSFHNPSDYAAVVERIRKNAEVEYYEFEGTHHLHLCKPYLVADIISNFLKSPAPVVSN